MRRITHALAVCGALTFGLFFAQAAQAVTVSSLDCSGIDTTDGNVADWENIPYIINTDESVEGTVYYLKNNGSWTTTQPDNYRYTANLEKQANITQMRICNTDTFFLNLRTEQPMMFFYDTQENSFVDFWNTYETSDGDQENFTLPADYPYWMVWKMQDVAGEGNIVYFAADLRMQAGQDLGDNDLEVPKLYLYEETDDVSFDEAAFDPSSDERLTAIDVSEDGEENIECDGDNPDPACDREEVAGDDYAFEVAQDISQLFQYADFRYGDTINITATMYNANEFTQSNGRSVMQTVDSTETKRYTFSSKAVRNLRGVTSTITEKSVLLRWRAIKNAESYTIKLINPNTDKTVRVIKGVKKNLRTVRALDADTTYRAVVRAYLGENDNGKKTYSAWSSGYKWTTDEE